MLTVAPVFMHRSENSAQNISEGMKSETAEISF